MASIDQIKTDLGLSTEASSPTIREIKSNLGLDLTPEEQFPAQTLPQTGLEKLESFLVGERPAIQAETTLGKVAAFVPNVVANIFRGPANKAVEMVEATDIVHQTSVQDDYRSALDSMAKMDEGLAQRIRNIPDTPEGKLLRSRLTKFIAQRGSIPEPFIPKSLDKTNLQSLGELVEMEALVAIMATPGIMAAQPFKQSLANLISKRNPLSPDFLAPLAKAVSSPLKDLSIVAMGYGAENALYGAIAEVAAPRKPGEKITAKELLASVATNTAIATPLSLLIGVGIPRWAQNRRAQAIVETAKDLAQTAPDRAARGVDEVPGYRREVVVNLKEKPIKSITTEIFEDVKPDDFSAAKVGDVVRTREGLSGVISGVQERMVTPGNAERFDATIQKLVDLETRISTFEQSGAPPEILGRLRDNAEALELYSNDLLISSKPEELLISGERVRTVSLKIRDSKGKLREIDLPYESLTQGGVVRRREFLVPENLERLRRTDPQSAIAKERAAANLTSAQLSSDRTSIDSGEGRITLPRTGEGVDADLRSTLEAEGHLVLSPEFTARDIGRATPFAFLRKEESTFRGSGIDFRRAQRAEAAADTEQIATFTKLRNLTNEVFKEAGITDFDPDSFFGNVRLMVSPKAKRIVAEEAERLFSVAQGERSISELRPAEQKLIQAWRGISDDLFARVNRVLVGLGKQPVKGKAEYITNILTAQASALKQLGGITDPGLKGAIEAAFGKRMSALFKRANPEEFLDVLLRQRPEGLPIERDFFKAANIAVSAHTRFIHLQPVLKELDLVLGHFRKVYGQDFPTNLKIMEDTLTKLSGRKIDISFLKSVDETLQSFLIAEKWLGFIKNPLRDKLGEYIRIEKLGEAFVPKRKVLSAFDRFGFERGALSPRFQKRMFFITQLAFSAPYVTTNMSQFWTLAIPRLRGPWKERYSSAVKGWLQAWGDWFDPKMRKHWKESGILQEVEKFEFHEMGDQSAKIAGGITTKGGALGKILNLTSEFSEFINRVATYRATHDNILKTKGSGYWKELDGLTDGELFKGAERLSKEMSDIVNFKFGITHRAPIADHPIGALWDQFNGFTRNWASNFADMWRNLKHDPEVRAAWQDYIDGKGTEKLTQVLTSPETTMGKRGEIIRFFMNGTAYLGVTSLLGMGIWKGATDVYLGGGTRLMEGFIDLKDGIRDMDQDRINRGVMSITLPPSTPPILNATRDAYQVVFGPEKFSIKRAAIQPYSPFKKPIHSLTILKAIWTQVPQPIHNLRTGKVNEMVDPEDAIQKLLFGARSKTDEQRNAELDLISSLRSKGRAKSDRQHRLANEIINEMESRDPAGRSKYWHDLDLKGTWEDEDLPKIIMDEMRARYLLKLDSVGRGLKTLPSEERAQFFQAKVKGMSEEQRRSYLSEQILQGNLTEEVAVEALK